MSLDIRKRIHDAVARLGRIAALAAIASALLQGQAAAQTPLACGQVVTGTITAPGEQHRFAFLGEPGDVVSLTLAQTAALDPAFTAVFTLAGPGTNTTRTTGVSFHTLPASGVYTISVHDVYNTGRGSYSLRLGWIQPLAKQCGDRTALACGQEVQGSIATELELDLLTFVGPQGANFNLTLLELADLDVGFQAHGELLGPNGIRLGFVPVRTTTPVTLPATGTYSVAIFDLGNFRRRGTYSLALPSTAV
jgi:hypothetical protein